ncbi:hypothetical protein D3C72_1873670 [compost metagenome]
MSNTLAASRKRSLNSSPARSTISACQRPANTSRVPGFGDLLARTCASTSCSFSTRSTSASILPPLAFWPNMRALITRVSLKTSTSPASRAWAMAAK